MTDTFKLILESALACLPLLHCLKLVLGFFNGTQPSHNVGVFVSVTVERVETFVGCQPQTKTVVAFDGAVDGNAKNGYDLRRRGGLKTQTRVVLRRQRDKERECVAIETALSS